MTAAVRYAIKLSPAVKPGAQVPRIAWMVIRLAMAENRASYAGAYRLLVRLGSGSFGTVWAGRREDPDGLAAVKVAESRYSDVAAFAASFTTEIRVMGQVQSDFVPKLIESQAHDAPAWIATELIPGPPLDKVIDRFRGLPADTVWHLGGCIADALAAIHACNIRHRDLRPKNVLLVADGPWVIDFNLAHIVQIAHRGRSLTPRADYGYMSPEEAQGGLREAKEPADIFALGATLVFAATGHAPFDGPAPASVINAEANLYGLERGDLLDLIESCLEKDAERRPSLTGLRESFARHTGNSGRNGFAATLPQEIAGWLQEYRENLASQLGTRGPARLGWGTAGPGTGVTGLPAPGGDSSPAPGAAEDDGGADRTPAPTTAHLRWPRPSRVGGWVAGAVAVDADKLVVTCLNGTVVVLGRTDGRPPAGWPGPADLRAALHSEALILPQDGGGACAYIGAADGRVHAIDLDSGLDRVVIEAGAPIEGAPVVAAGRVCVVSADGRVHAVDPRTGERTVLFQLAGAATGTPSATSDTIFAADAGGHVYAIDAASGRAWQSAAGGLVLGAPVPMAQWLYVCGTDGTLREIDVKDGSHCAVTDVGAPVHVTPARDGNLLYVGGSDGVVHAYRAGHRGTAELEEAWHIPLDAEIAGLAVFRRRVFVAAGYRLMEVAGPEHCHELLRMECLIGAPPVISGRDCYVVGLGGTVNCLTLS